MIEMDTKPARPLVTRPVLRFAVAAILGICAVSPANADVLEVSSDGARWVAGGPAAPDLPSAEALAVPMEAVQLPEGFNGAPRHAVTTPQLSSAGTVPARYAATMSQLSQRFDLSVNLLEALVWQESRWRENAVSPAGARGLAQLMPGTARYLGVDPDDPAQNLEGGARYLREQLDRFDGDLERALAAYNAGPGRVIRARGIPNITETKNYVASIMGRLASRSRSAY